MAVEKSMVWVRKADGSRGRFQMAADKATESYRRRQGLVIDDPEAAGQPQPAKAPRKPLNQSDVDKAREEMGLNEPEEDFEFIENKGAEEVVEAMADSPQEQSGELAKMDRPALFALAEKRGIKVPKNIKTENLIEKLK
jgi:hypothetical protein